MGLIFLVIWLYVVAPDGKPVPTAQFLSTFKSMKECTAVKERIQAKDVDLKNRVSCMNIVPIADDASESL